MVSIKEITNEVTTRGKKVLQSPWFWAAGGAVLMYFLWDSGNRDTSVQYTTATGYDGYPDASGDLSTLQDNMDASFSDFSDRYLTDMETLTDYINTKLESQSSDIDSRIDNALSNMNFVQKEELTPTDSMSDVSKAVKINEMYQNSIAYQYARTTAEKNALLKANEAIGAQIGAVKVDGAWYTDGSMSERLFVVSKSDPVASGNVKYNKTVDYQKRITEAQSRGASQEEINLLKAQREAKILGEKLTQYYGTLSEHGKSKIPATVTGQTKTTTTTKTTQTKSTVGNSIGGNSGTAGGKTNTSNAVTYDKNVDYQKKINEAKKAGASSSEIAKLESQRQAKIKGEKLTQYYGTL